jgi:hypothetical protein
MDPDAHYTLILHPGKLAKLKYKCLIGMVSLLECNDEADNMLLRIVRAIPLKVLTENLSRIFTLYDKYKSKDQYEINLFNRVD